MMPVFLVHGLHYITILSVKLLDTLTVDALHRIQHRCFLTIFGNGNGLFVFRKKNIVLTRLWTVCVFF